MFNQKFLAAALVGAAMIASPAIARDGQVTPRHHAQGVNASASTVNHIHGRFGTTAPHASAFLPAPPDGENCDVGDNPAIC
jgi:hypothetical protein